MWQISSTDRLFTIAAILLFLVLVGLQLNWLLEAIRLQQEESRQRLHTLAPEIALAFDSYDHDAFHSETDRLSTLPIENLQVLIDSVLLKKRFSASVAFGVYRDQSKELLLSNGPAYELELTTSTAKACLSCIIAFSIGPKIEPEAGESSEAFRERLYAQSTHRYFSPVDGLRSPAEDQIWLGLHLIPKTPWAWHRLGGLFAVNVLFLVLVLSLFGYLLRAFSRQKKLSEVKEDFFNNLTHEFKTPLGAIRLASRVLRQTDDHEKRTSYHLVIEKESDRLGRQIDQLLELSMLDRQGISINETPLDISVLVQESVEKLDMQITAKEAQVQVLSTPEPSWVKGHPVHLRNVFANLVENSLKYGPMGVQVQIEVNKSGTFTHIQVRDNGPGVAPQMAASIFERFVRGTKRNQYAGHGFGIGLSYAHTVITQHGGQITLNQQYQNGCAFDIKLPAYSASGR